jgi:hypothetical protein
MIQQLLNPVHSVYPVIPSKKLIISVIKTESNIRHLVREDNSSPDHIVHLQN